MSYPSKLVEFIYRNRFSTTEIADSLGKTGNIPRLQPVLNGAYKVGVAKCIFTANGSNYYLHEQLDSIGEGDIVLVFTQYCDGKAVFGDIVAKYILDVRKAEGIVVQGDMRDLSELKSRKYPVWCSGFTPIGCVNKATSPFPYEDRESLEVKYNGSILICDDCGVVAIPIKYQTERMMRRLEGMRLQEDVWNYCIDELGWNTVQTICDKEYLQKPELLPSKYRDKLDLLRINFASEPGTN